MRAVAITIVAVLVGCGDNGAAPVDAPMPIAPHLVALPLAVPANGTFYTVALTIGGTAFDAIVDTGSTTTGVAAAGCTNCDVTPVYVPGADAIDEQMTVLSSYGDLTGWSGEIYEDVVAVAGLDGVELDFGAIETSDGFFREGERAEAILGLGADDLLKSGTTSFLDQLAAAGEVDTIAFRLCPDRGDLWIGGFDPSAATAAPQFTPMLARAAVTAPYYEINVADLFVGSADLGLTAASFGNVTVDTGSSASVVPVPVLAAMLAAIDAAPAFATLFPGQSLTANAGCVTGSPSVTTAMVDAMLPSLTFEFATATGAPFSVAVTPTQSYFSEFTPGEFCLTFSAPENTDPANNSRLGDLPLAGMLTVFDLAHQQIGFAPESGCAEAPDPSVMSRAHVPSRRRARR